MRRARWSSSISRTSETDVRGKVTRGGSSIHAVAS
jgi:hypothetical protein